MMVLSGLVACGKGELDQEQISLNKQQVTSTEVYSHPSQQAKIFKGYAVYGPEMRTFQQCDTSEVLWAIDRQGILWQFHKERPPHQQPYIKLFAMVKGQRGPAPKDGFGADYAGSLLIEEVLYVAAEGFDCNYNWQQFLLRALGNEPFWSATVQDNSMIVTRLGEQEISYAYISKQQAGQNLSFQGKSNENASMKLEVIKQPCRDTMSGAYYGLTSRLKLNGKELTGCAIPGEGN